MTYVPNERGIEKKALRDGEKLRWKKRRHNYSAVLR